MTAALRVMVTVVLREIHSWVFCFVFFKDLCFFLNFIYFIYFWLHWVLVAACGIFVEARGIFVVVHRLLSSCGTQAPGYMGSVVVALRFQSAWAL